MLKTEMVIDTLKLLPMSVNFPSLIYITLTSNESHSGFITKNYFKGEMIMKEIKQTNKTKMTKQTKKTKQTQHNKR